MPPIHLLAQRAKPSAPKATNSVNDAPTRLATVIMSYVANPFVIKALRATYSLFGLWQEPEPIK